MIEGSGLSADFVLVDATFEQNFEGVSPMQVNVRLAQDAAVDESRARIEHALAPFPTAEVRDAEEAEEKAAANVDELLGLLLALLLLSVVVALLGIANTLSLSIFERFREIGLLRAVGATRAQVRSTVHWEALLVTLGRRSGTRGSGHHRVHCARLPTGRDRAPGGSRRPSRSGVARKARLAHRHTTRHNHRIERTSCS